MTTGAEFEEALAQAEVLLRQADAARQAIGRYRTMSVLGWGAAGAVVATLLALTPDLALLLPATALMTAASATLTWAIGKWGINPLRDVVRRDERCAAATVSLLREMLPFVAREEQWTLFRTERAKLRFGRFPIRGGRA
ncbi:hypothetical protein [Plantactinospora endophytica]|uniref:SLATT domain-containing protein n=1 Tax=Plantactinospora endophytica TaxID=673535 RepID=A0ABQ4EBX5_9ACTN|nr:hypothetical protein [Plantactinospora endophytica]GIG92214.1 hypothetical protein Pen02_71500 [Plantactinospora endophytica]